MNRLAGIFMLSIALLSGQPALAYDTYQVGHISNVTFADDSVFIILDTGVPTNCTGTPYGWMVVPAANKAMTAFVLGLWLRGDISQVSMAVYTSGRDSSSFCQINQIDPAE